MNTATIALDEKGLRIESILKQHPLPKEEAEKTHSKATRIAPCALVVGFLGRAKSGKDTACSIMRSALSVNHKTVRVAFGDALKQELADACGVDKAFIEEHKDQFRVGLQWFGTEMRRQFFGQDYWIKRLDFKLRDVYIHGAKVICVTDCRLKNEYDYLKSIGAILIRVKRPLITDLDMHSTENELTHADVDFTIHNNADLDSLRTQVQELTHSYIVPLIP
jgi:hypothetical protein